MLKFRQYQVNFLYMTSAAAQCLRLIDRGPLKEGLAADLVVFNPETIIDGSPEVKVHHATPMALGFASLSKVTTSV